MDSGTEVNRYDTETLESQGFWRRGTLLSWNEQLWLVMGYWFYGWAENSQLLYKIVLNHVRTGLASSFPLEEIMHDAVEIKEG